MEREIPRPVDTDEQRKEKEYYRKVSTFRIKMEHATSSIKRIELYKEAYKLKVDNFVNYIFKTYAAYSILEWDIICNRQHTSSPRLMRPA